MAQDLYLSDDLALQHSLSRRQQTWKRFCEPDPTLKFRAIWLDPEKYRKYLPETLETQSSKLGNMMSEFVDLGFGTGSVQTALKTKSPPSPENLQPVAQRTSGEDHWLSRTETRTQVLRTLDTFLKSNL